MSLTQEVEQLRRIPMFAKIDPAKLKLLAFASERLTFAAGQELFRQGDVADAAYIIVDGTAEVVIETPQGPLKVADLGMDDFVGEIGTICDVPRTATVRAVTCLTTLKISKELFLRMMTDFPEVAVEIVRVLAHRLELMNQQLRTLRTGGGA